MNDTVIEAPMRAFLLGEKMMPQVQADVDGFGKVEAVGRQFAATMKAEAAFALQAPYTFMMCGFLTPVEHCAYNERMERYDPDLSHPRGRWLQETITKIRHESEIFKFLGIDNVINVGMPQNCCIVCPRISVLPIIVIYGMAANDPPPWEGKFKGTPESERDEYYVELDPEETELVKLEMANTDLAKDMVH